MAVFNRFDRFALDVLQAKHNFLSHVFKIALTDTAPSASLTVLSGITQIATGAGYASGGNVAPLTATDTGDTAKVSGSDVTFTAAGGAMGPLRYAVLYNDTASGKPLVAWWDYGASITLANTEQFTVRFDAVNGIFTLS
jgi:hypothetical protein